MEIVPEGSTFPRLPAGSAVTIGTFDGVHRGHQALIAELSTLAAERGAATVAVTFDRHPASVVRPESAPRLLTDLTQKLERLAAAGIDYTYVVHFDEERSLEPPEHFLRSVMLDTLQARVVVVGEDYHFGHRRRGDVALLAEVGADVGVKVIGMGLVEVDGVDGPVTSTRIRTALAAGDVRHAELLLGRPHEVHGVVEHGDGRGRTIGFPTANVAVPGDIMLPVDGVYAGAYVRPDGAEHRAAISLGRRPTFYTDNGMLLLEAHLLDFDDDLYGEHARVSFSHFLRGQVKYDSIESLCAQLTKDVEATRSVA